MKNKFVFGVLRLFGVSLVCLLLSSFSPSLDGRAIVVEDGTFPQGLFAKTVGYLPGDVISVTGVSGDNAVDLLVIGALDPSEGVAIMLSPEAAEAIGLDKNADNIVKITKRSDQDERVFGSAVISSRRGDFYDDYEYPDFASSDDEEDFNAVAAVDDGDDIENSDFEPEEEPPVQLAKEPDFTVEPFDEIEPADEEIAAVVPQEKEEETVLSEAFFADEIPPFAETEVSSEPELALADDAPVPELPPAKEAYEELESQIVEDELAFDFYDESEYEQFEPDDLNEIAYNTVSAEGEEAVSDDYVPFYDELIADAEELSGEKLYFDQEDETFKDVPNLEPYNEIEQELVLEDVPSFSDYAEEEELVFDEVEEKGDKLSLIDNELDDDFGEFYFDEEDLADLNRPRTPYVSDDEYFDFELSDGVEFVEEKDAENTEEIAFEKEESDAVAKAEGEDDSLSDDEYQAIVLVPAGENPPEAEAEESKSDDVINLVVTPVVTKNEKEAALPALPAEKTEALADYTKYQVDSLSELQSGSYYVQIAMFSLDESEKLGEAISQYGTNYPLAVVPTANGKYNQLLVGALNIDEYGTVLARFKSYGYKDAFLRKIK